MQSEEFKELYNRVKQCDHFESGKVFPNVIECIYNFDNILRIVFEISKNGDDKYEILYEVQCAREHYDKEFIGSLDEVKEELDIVIIKAANLVEVFKSMTRDVL